MKKIFTKIKKNFTLELAALCGAAAFLLVVAGLVTPAGQDTLRMAFADAESQTAQFCTRCGTTVAVWSFTADPNPAPEGSPTTIRIETTNADRCALNSRLARNPPTRPQWQGAVFLWAQAGVIYHQTQPINDDMIFLLKCYNTGTASRGETPYYSLIVPAGPPPPCSSAPNICGQTNQGQIIGGTCNATTPSNSSCPCQSPANSCGMRTTGYYLQNGICTARVAPPNILCPAAPTVTINAGAGNGVAVSRPAGTPVTITATFTPRTGDTITGSAINGPNSGSSVPGGNTAPASTKTYVLPGTTPAGSYTFRPALTTTYYPAWSDYGRSVVVTITGSLTCPGANEINPPTCSCAPGYQRVPPSTTCTVIPIVVPPPAPVLTFSAESPRVQPGSAANLTWNVSGLIATDSCTISSVPAGTLSRSHGPSATATSWSGTASPTITGNSVFTLSCTRGTAQSVTVGLIPVIIER